MSDDFDDEETQHRLVIDDPESSDNINQQSGRSINPNNSDGAESGITSQIRNSNGRLDSPEAMDVSLTKSADSDLLGNGHASDRPVKAEQGSDHTSVSSKRASTIVETDGDFKHKKSFLSPAAKKRKMVDKSTCVFAKTCQADDDMNLLSMKNGSTTCINITIVCKSGRNTLFILAKWKGHEYHGVLTDGEHPMEPYVSNTQKNGNNDSMGYSGSAKARGKRGGRAVDKKSRYECNESDDNGENAGRADCEDGAGLKLVEMLDKDYARCPHRQCGFKFNSISDLNTHMLFTHVTEKATLVESIASQTSHPSLVDAATDNCANNTDFLVTCDAKQPVLCAKCQHPIVETTSVVGQATQAVSEPKMTGSNVMIIEDQTRSMDDLFKAVRMSPASNQTGRSVIVGEDNCAGALKGESSAAKDGNTPSAFSDISDDGAPTLEKEESYDKNTNQNAPKKTDESLNILAPPISGTALDWLSGNLSTSSDTIQTHGEDTAKSGVNITSSSNLPKSLPEGASLSGGNGDATSVATSTVTSTPPIPSATVLAAATAANGSLTPAQQQHMSQLMAGLASSGASMQNMAALLNLPPNVSTPLQPNFPLNSPYFPMNMSPASAPQPFVVNPAAKAPPPVMGFSPTAGFGVGQAASLAAAAAAAAAANGLSPAGPTPSAGNVAQQKPGNTDHLNVQRHKIYELKTGSNTSQASSSLLMAASLTGGGSKDGVDATGNNSVSRLSTSGMSHGPDAAPSPMRPSSSSAIPPVSSMQRNMFKRPPTNSPSSSSSGAQFLGGIAGGIPPNLAVSPALNPQQAAMMFNQQQLNHFRNLGLPMANFFSPEQLVAQYAALLGGASQMTGAVQPPFSQPQQPTTQSQPQFSHPPPKQ